MVKYKKEKQELFHQNIRDGFSISDAWGMAKETVEIWLYFDKEERKEIAGVETIAAKMKEKLPVLAVRIEEEKQFLIKSIRENFKN